MFIPIEGEEDYIVNRLGWNILQRGNIKLEDVEGRKLSECSPFFYEIFNEPFKEILKTKEPKAMRIFYYVSDKIQTLTNVQILCDEGNIFVISDYVDGLHDEKSLEEKKIEDDANKSNLIEYFSQ